MDAKKKTKIWMIIFLSMLGVAAVLAVSIGQKTQLFRGGPFSGLSSCFGKTQVQCIATSGCTWEAGMPPLVASRCTGTAASTPTPDINFRDIVPGGGGTFGISVDLNAAQPDLKASLLSWTPNPITVGSSVIFSANVQNIGTAATLPNFMVRFCIDNDRCATDTTGRLGGTDSIYAASLGSGTSSSMSSVAWTATTGEHKVVFCVDITNIVTPELRNDNNCATRSFPVGAAAPLTPVANPDYLPQADKYEPADESTITTLTPTLRWRLQPTNVFPAGTQPYHFRFGLAEDSSGQSVLRHEFGANPAVDVLPPGFPASCGTAISGVTNAWTCTELTVPPGVLRYGTRYRWYVHANNGEKFTQWCSEAYQATNPYCGSANHVFASFATPAAPNLDVTATQATGQNTTIPAITNQTIKLFTLNFAMSGGDALTDRLKKIVLEYQDTNALEISKITDLHLFRGDSTEFTVGATNKDLISLNKNATNGTIEIVFQTAGPTTLLADPKNQHLTLRAKINASQGDNGKKIAYILRSVEVEPADASKIGLAISTPEFLVHEDPPDAPTATFQAAPASMNRGQSTTLTWTVTGATTMNIDQGIGNIQGTGSRTVNPTTDTTYTLTATNAGGTITRAVAIAVAQPAAAAPTMTTTTTAMTTAGNTAALVPQTCEQQGLHTYTGPPKPGERVNGMCIPCATQIYIANGGSCEVKKKKKSGSAVDRAFEPTNTTQPSSATAGGSAGAVAGGQQRGSASEPSLQGSQRLVRAPEKANTGPETLVYIGILGAVHAGLWLRRRMKR